MRLVLLPFQRLLGAMAFLTLSVMVVPCRLQTLTGSLTVDGDGNLRLMAPASGTIVVNDTDLLAMLQTVREVHEDVAALKRQNAKLNDIVASLQAENRRLNASVASFEITTSQAGAGDGGLPSDLGEFANVALKVTGAALDEVNGYYTQLPHNCVGKVCFVKILGPPIVIAWRMYFFNRLGIRRGTGNGWTFSSSYWNGVYNAEVLAQDAADYTTATNVLYSSTSGTATPPVTGWSPSVGGPIITFL